MTGEMKAIQKERKNERKNESHSFEQCNGKMRAIQKEIILLFF